MGDNLLFDLAYDNDAAGLASALETGRDANQIHPSSGHTPLQAACDADAIDAIRVLLRAGADPNFEFTFVSRVSGRAYASRVALMYACSAQAVDLLVDGGASVNHADAEGWTALALAVNAGSVDVVTRLLELGASRTLNGRVGDRFADIDQLCDARKAHFRGNGDPAKTAPVVARLEVIKSKLHQ